MAAGILLWVPDNGGANWPVIVPLDGDVWLWLDGEARDYLELVLEENGLRSGEMLDVTFEGNANGLVVETAQAISGETHLLPGLQAQADGQLRLGDFVFRNHNGWVQYRAHGADGAPWNPIASVAEFSTRILGIALGAAELKTLLAVLFAERRLDVLLLPIDPGFLLVPCLADGFPGSPLGIVEELHRGVRDEREQEEAESRRRAAQFRNAVQLEEYRKTFDSEEIFVNPYNFVPLTEEVIRTEPVDRSVLAAGRRMGHIDVEWVAATPLLFGNGVGADRTGLEQDEAHRYRVAGSSLKGAISSLHEALCGSCLRVAELDFVPSYREKRRPWRRFVGAGALRDRLPQDAVTCGEDGALDSVCPSCELFGVIAGDGSDDAEAAAVHQALRGLVRFSHLSIDTDERALEQRSLPTPGAPSMGAGQFYLTIENTAPGDPPTAQWGSTHDNTAAGLRRMRGRKFYWHADSPEVDMANGAWSRASARPHHLQGAGKRAQQVELVPAGSKVRARLHFENLDDRQLGSLIAAIAPDLALREFLPTTWIDTTGTGERRKLRTHLGGAKPLGLGSVEVCTVSVHVENERYRSGASATALTAEEISELAGAFVASIAQHGTDHLVALAAMLDPDRVRSDRVSYPPGGRWGAVDSQTFDSPFTFFARTQGRQDGRDQGPIVALPRPEMNPWMNIDGTPEGGGDV